MFSSRSVYTFSRKGTFYEVEGIYCEIITNLLVETAVLYTGIRNMYYRICLDIFMAQNQSLLQKYMRNS